MKDCLFCQIIARDIPAHVIYEDEHAIAFLDIFPNSEGHTLVIPKEHSEDFSSTTLENIAYVNVAKKAVIKLLSDKLQPKGFNFISNNGAEAFQVVFHYHEHIIPKYVKSEGYIPSKNKVEHRTNEQVYELLTK
ncbi:HIT family protein [Williamsoniiplasma lucivorax]|uniref:Histidine triad protein n=1 Tax=Williamsoniiplasma lucivorax TaxID=209274 RepID=A0A2S5RDQ6_9MOLU|nr:HIT family protein [Williamsoniiplasma lucivorax]PPE05437.1 histidine triad protein [Williamsoniiplasma lucivorax]